MNTAQTIRFRSALPLAASGQVATGSSALSFPGNLGLAEWNALTSLQKIDFLRRNAMDRQQLADALTYGLEHGYNEIGPAVGVAEAALNKVGASGQVCSGCGCGMGGCGCAVRVLGVVAPSGQAASSGCDCSNRGIAPSDCRCSGRSTRAIVPSGQASTAATTTPAASPAPTTAAATQHGVKPAVFVAVTAAAVLGVYLYRRAQHHQFRDNPERPYGNPPPYGL